MPKKIKAGRQVFRLVGSPITWRYTMSCNKMSLIPDSQMPSSGFVHDTMEILRVSCGRNSILVIVVLCVTCFLLGHQIGEKKRESSLVATFAKRRAHLLEFCQKKKNSSDPPARPRFLSFIKNIPGDIFRMSDQLFIFKKLN